MSKKLAIVVCGIRYNPYIEERVFEVSKVHLDKLDTVRMTDNHFFNSYLNSDLTKVVFFTRNDLTDYSRIKEIRKKHKHIFLVGFSETFGKTQDEQYLEGLKLCKEASCNLVFASDEVSNFCMVITPEEARYPRLKKGTSFLADGIDELVDITKHRSHLMFTQSTVISGDPIPWNSETVPSSLRTVVDYCREKGAYKPFSGVTAGHFAVKLTDKTFLTSIRKTDFNKLPEIGLVKVETDTNDTVLAYGAKPSVGGQSQRIVFKDHVGYDCVLHFHCPKKEGSQVPIVSQREFECGSHECGKNTSFGLKQFGNLKAVYLDEHGPNIIFNKSIDPQEVIKFIDKNFDLSQKTGGFVSIDKILTTPNTLDVAKNLL